MKKILFLINSLGEGGAEKVLVTLVKNLDRNRFDITVMTLFDIGVNKESLPGDVRYISHFKSMPRGNSHIMKLFSPKTLHRHFIKDRYDIEVAFLEGPCARIISGCENKETKLISWTHCTWHSKREFSRSYRSFNEAEKCCSRFDRNVFVSNGVREAFEKYCHAENCEVIYNVNDSDLIHKLSDESVTDVDFDKDTFNIISVGKIIPVKGFDRLARIHKRLTDEGYRIHTYVLGIGSQQKEIEDYCNKNSIRDSFTLLGYQSNPYKYMNKADLFVCSSYSEGLSTAVTEALIVGLPIVTTDVSGMRELLGDNNEYGIIVDNNETDLENAIKQFIMSKELAQKYKLLAFDRGKYFSKVKILTETERLFNDI